jgi:hypothetical protein
MIRSRSSVADRTDPVSVHVAGKLPVNFLGKIATQE